MTTIKRGHPSLPPSTSTDAGRAPTPPSRANTVVTSTTDFQEPAILRPTIHDGVSEYYLQEREGKHWFSSDAYLDKAMGLFGMDPTDPTKPALVEGGHAADIRGPDGKLVVPAGDNGPFGGEMLVVRVGERLKLTVDGSRASQPFNLHWHGVHGEKATPDPTNADILPMMGVGPALPDEGLGGPMTATTEFTVDGLARTRAIHAHTVGMKTGMAGTQVRSGLVIPTIIKDKLSDKLEREGLPHHLGVDDLPIILQDEQQTDTPTATGTIDTRVEDDTDADGKLGNHISVNGVFNPTFDVKTGLMRLRIQNYSTARQLKVAFDNNQDFYVVAGQQGFLQHPIKVNGKDGLLLAPTEGAELVWQPDPKKTDKNGQVALLSRPFTPDNLMFTPGTRGPADPDGDEHEKEGRPDQGAGMEIMHFNVPGELKAPPVSDKALFGPGGRLHTLRPLEPLTIADVEKMKLPTRTFQMEGPPLSDNAEKVFDALMATDSAKSSGTVTLDQATLQALAKSTGADVDAAIAEMKKDGNLTSTANPEVFGIKDLARTINGTGFDMGKMNGTIPAGSREVWEIDNPSDMPHPFHIHGRRFRVIDVTNLDGSPAATSPLLVPKNAHGHLGEEADTINLAPGQKARILVDFSDAVPGEMLMVHCHNMEHEDGGMMQMFQFVDPKAPATGDPGNNSMPGMPDMPGMPGMSGMKM